MARFFTPGNSYPAATVCCFLFSFFFAFFCSFFYYFHPLRESCLCEREIECEGWGGMGGWQCRVNRICDTCTNAVKTKNKFGQNRLLSYQ